jgi:hypothetical protein
MGSYLLLRFGLPDDGFIWLLLLLLVFAAAALCGGLALACAHVLRAPKVLVRQSILLLPLTLLIFWSFDRERRAVPGMLASADSARGVILGHNVFGNLGVFYRFGDQRGRFIAAKKHAHAQLMEGDSIQLYFARAPGHPLVDVWPPGPDVRQMLWHVLWLWVIGSATLAGYGPRVSRWLGKPLLKAWPMAASAGGAGAPMEESSDG